MLVRTLSENQNQNKGWCEGTVVELSGNQPKKNDTMSINALYIPCLTLAMSSLDMFLTQ
jgi:hypothetical protein